MVGVAKKLVDKAGSKGKLWISGLYEYRITPQSGSIASPLQLITQRTTREKDLPQLPSTLGAQQMYETHQELIRRQQNKPEKNYIELTPGMPVWVQYRQNTSWEPATVMSQCNSNSYWIMQENGTDNPKCIEEPKLCSRSDAPMSERQGTATANRQNQRKLSFKLLLLPMQQETVSSTILQRMYHRTLSTQLNQTLKHLLLLIPIRRKGGNHRNCRCTCTCTYTCTCTCTGES